MTDDPITPPPRSRGRSRPATAVAARRRAGRLVASSLVAVVVLAGAALAVTADLPRRAVQLAADADGASRSPAAPPAAAVTALPARAEGEVVAVDGGFVIVSGAVPAQVWSSRDGRRWVRRSADGLPDDLLVDVGAATDGTVAALTATGQLWTSGNDGTTWTQVPLPTDVGPVSGVAGDGRRWLLAGARGREVRLTAVPRTGRGPIGAARGDLEVAGLRVDLPPAAVASGSAGTVLVAEGSAGPVVWVVARDLTTTRVDGAFGDAHVSGVTATAAGFTASVLPVDADRPELWRSADGRTWTAVADDLPLPSCAVVVESAGAAVAGGSPCDEDAGWELWRRTPGDGWVRIGREVERR